MATVYDEIANDRERLERTARNSIRTLSELYADRAHFIYELLQNAEDALRRRPRGWRGSRAVTFSLSDGCLRISHFGEPFNTADVQAICSVGETTKELTDIGRFGIGFKSVYAFTDRPRIHSGMEDFAIESYVRPVSAQSIQRDTEETVILIPLKPTDKSSGSEIAAGLEGLGATTLLFLRQIDEIRWSVDGGHSGLYLREVKNMAPWVRRVTVIGQVKGEEEVDETWLVFSRPVATDNGLEIGHVEIAFSLYQGEKTRCESIQPIEHSPLVVFFPTVVETHFGFFVQGPYRTTPSRDNVPKSDPWNQRLVGETASLLVDALCWLRDQGSLDATTLCCLPLDPRKFGEENMFAPLFEATKQALMTKPLLPRLKTGYISAPYGRLARTQELRKLFAPSQLATLFGHEGKLFWLSGEITQDRMPELRHFLIHELGIEELTPETIIPKLNKQFLEAQSDGWVHSLYEFLSNQPALRLRLRASPLIRLEDGNHVVPEIRGQPQAFLPGAIKTSFPTVGAAVCATAPALAFLRAIGLTEPDAVDDVIRNVMPKYSTDEVDVGDAEYHADICRILAAFSTASKGQLEKLLAALRETPFVKVVDAGDGSKGVSKPSEVYLATERLKVLFSGVKGVMLVDDGYSCLRGEEVRELLEVCGATRYLQTISVETDLSWEQRRGIRRYAGLERANWEWPIADATVRGLQDLLDILPRLDAQTRRHKSGLLWEALADLESRRGSRAFLGEYTWSYSHESKTATFDAAFVRVLNETDWVPGASGELHRPELVFFDSLNWQPNPFLQSKIRFKPPVIEQLAKEAGIEPGVLDLLKRLGVTSEAELRARLGVTKEQVAGDGSPKDNVGDALKNLLGDVPEPTPPSY